MTTVKLPDFGPHRFLACVKKYILFLLIYKQTKKQSPLSEFPDRSVQYPISVVDTPQYYLQIT